MTPFSSVPGRYTHASFHVPMARNTALYWLSRSLSVISVPTAMPQLELHAEAADQLDLAADHRAWAGDTRASAKRSMPPGSGIGFVDRDLVPSSAR